jgi:hypothetical protein
MEAAHATLFAAVKVLAPATLVVRAIGSSDVLLLIIPALIGPAFIALSPESR